MIKAPYSKLYSFIRSQTLLSGSEDNAEVKLVCILCDPSSVLSSLVQIGASPIGRASCRYAHINGGSLDSTSARTLANEHVVAYPLHSLLLWCRKA